MIATFVLAASLATSPVQKPASQHTIHIQKHQFAVTLHPMTEEEKQIYPGRENWDKTEWYEAQFKSAKITLLPTHVDEWKNGGIDLT
ncbi:MAG TPA: hypothetical protein VGM92_12210 [Candidatus Kapabacteria bacterium]